MAEASPFPVQPPVEPMLATLARELPAGPGLRYEPKWDGFRCLAFREHDDVDLRSRNQRPLARYFPEVVADLRALDADRFVLDGELMVLSSGRFSFGDLMSRLHPAASRVERLARERPARFVAFDLLADVDGAALDRPFDERRRRLEALVGGLRGAAVVLSPLSEDVATARSWLDRFSGHGIDGVVVKDGRSPYEPGRRTMTKVKLERTADCVVGGFRPDATRPRVASLLLGLYDEDDGRDVLRHVGVASSFTVAARERLFQELAPLAVPLRGHPWEHGYALEGGPMGRLHGAAGRWTPDLELDWVPLDPRLVCEVTYDQVDGHRFRHPARWRRWRPDRSAASCRVDQLLQPHGELGAVLPG